MVDSCSNLDANQILARHHITIHGTKKNTHTKIMNRKKGPKDKGGILKQRNEYFMQKNNTSPTTTNSLD